MREHDVLVVGLEYLQIVRFYLSLSSSMNSLTPHEFTKPNLQGNESSDYKTSRKLHRRSKRSGCALIVK
jgi:hypothetical protein